MIGVFISSIRKSYFRKSIFWVIVVDIRELFILVASIL